MIQLKQLIPLNENDISKQIYSFLDNFAELNPNWDEEYDDEDDKYTSPDASQMKYCADMILLNKKTITM